MANWQRDESAHHTTEYHHQKKQYIGKITEIAMNKIPFLTLYIRQFQVMTPETHTVQMATPLTCATRYKASFSDAP